MGPKIADMVDLLSSVRKIEGEKRKTLKFVSLRLWK